METACPLHPAGGPVSATALAPSRALAKGASSKQRERTGFPAGNRSSFLFAVRYALGRYSRARALSATFSGVKPKALNRAPAGADAPK